MALRFIESFDHLASADLAYKYNQVISSPTIGAYGRNSTNGCRFNGSGQVITKTFDSQATWIVGMAAKFNTFANAGAGIIILKDSGTVHVDLRLNAAGILYVTRNGTTLGTGSIPLATGTGYYIEFKCNISDTAGAPSWRINEVADTITWVVGNGTNQDTRNGVNASANQVSIAGSTNVSESDYDDIYICDGTDGTATQGAANNDFLGDVRVEALLVAGAGNSAQWNRSTGADNYANVDDTTPDEDATYNYELTSGDIDSFAMGNLTTTSGTIIGVQSVLQARKDDAGTRSLQPHYRINGTNYARTSVALPDTYRYITEIEGKDPNTGSLWTISGVNGAEFGYKIP